MEPTNTPPLRQRRKLDTSIKPASFKINETGLTPNGSDTLDLPSFDNEPPRSSERAQTDSPSHEASPQGEHALEHDTLSFHTPSSPASRFDDAETPFKPTETQDVRHVARDIYRPDLKPSNHKQPSSLADNQLSARHDTKPVPAPRLGALKMASGNGVAYWGATHLVSLSWIGGLSALAASEGLMTIGHIDPLKLALMAIAGILPLSLIYATAFALRQAAFLAIETANAKAMAHDMLTPSVVASAQTAHLLEGLRQQVEMAVMAVKSASHDVEAMSMRLKTETDQINATAKLASLTTTNITEALRSERQAMSSLSQELDQQALGVIDAVDRQARMVAEASDLAQTQLHEAEASLAARATDLTAAASDVQDTARIIAEDLGRQTLRLESAGSGVIDQMKQVEEGLSQQRSGLVNAALSLRADQEDFAAHLEDQRNQLTQALAITRMATVDLGETSSRGIDVLRDIVVAAQENFEKVIHSADSERSGYESRIHATLSNISIMAAEARDDLLHETQKALENLSSAADSARKAADIAASAAQTRVDRLNETLFEAGKIADETFDQRLNSARRLIESSANLVGEASEATKARLDQSFAEVIHTLGEVDHAFSSLNERASQLPALAKERIDDIRHSVEDGIRAMTEAARLAALETQGVDKSFQERVQHNYDMLNETVRLMSLVTENAANSLKTKAQDMGRDLPKDYGRTEPRSEPRDELYTQQDRPQGRLQTRSSGLERPSERSAEPRATEARPQEHPPLEYRNYERSDNRAAIRPSEPVRPERSKTEPKKPDQHQDQGRDDELTLPLSRPLSRPSRLKLTPVNEKPTAVPAKPTPQARPATQPNADTYRSSSTSKPQDNPQNLPTGWTWRDLINGMEAKSDQTGNSQTGPSASHTETVPPAPEPSAPPITKSHKREPFTFDYVPEPVNLPASDSETQDQGEFDGETLDELMIEEIRTMGIDAHDLLNRSRLDETIHAILSEDNEGARLTVRRFAPTAVRRLTRRLVADSELRDMASEFIAFYDRQLNVALLARDAKGALNAVLANDTGRAYLLVDAAISDII